MRKDEYLSLLAIKDFLDWVETILDTPRSFYHRYHHSKEKKTYTFDNLLSAYQQYRWPSTENIDTLAANLAAGMAKSDKKACADACYGILKWGQIPCGKWLPHHESEICSYLKAVRVRLAMDLPSDAYFFPGMQMTSGFSKIYSAFIDDFMIYDSRVGAALGLLVREFCRRTQLPQIPAGLLFAWIPGRSHGVRNPSRDGFVFPAMWSNPRRYLENNIRANWLMSAVADRTSSGFACIDTTNRLKALEKALFMIGYDVS